MRALRQRAEQSFERGNQKAECTPGDGSRSGHGANTRTQWAPSAFTSAMPEGSSVFRFTPASAACAVAGASSAVVPAEPAIRPAASRTAIDRRVEHERWSEEPRHSIYRQNERYLARPGIMAEEGDTVANGSSAATSARRGASRSRAETISSSTGSGHSIPISGSSQAIPRSTAGS